jgi:hypothetical protein
MIASWSARGSGSYSFLHFKPGAPERQSFFIRICTGTKSCSDIHIGAKEVKSISLTHSTSQFFMRNCREQKPPGFQKDNDCMIGD